MAFKAFIFGVNTLGLKFCERDAQKLSESLKEYGYEINTPTSSDKATIQYTFESMLDNATKIDTLLMYFSGHGLIENGDLWFLLSDNASKLTTKLSINQYMKNFARCQARNKLVILDCCHAEQGVANLHLDLSERFLVLAASDRLEKSIEMDAFEASFFTHHLCQALNNPPQEILKDGKNISIYNLHTWLSQKAQTHNGRNEIQVPIPKLLGPHSDFTLATSAKAPTTNLNNFDLILEKLKDIVQLQIKRYARHKYIEGLYVHRKLQTDIGIFYLAEPEIASKLKQLISEQVKSSQNKIERLIELMIPAKTVFEELEVYYNFLVYSSDTLSDTVSKLKSLMSEQAKPSQNRIERLIVLMTAAQSAFEELEQNNALLFDSSKTLEKFDGEPQEAHDTGSSAFHKTHKQVLGVISLINLVKQQLEDVSKKSDSLPDRWFVKAREHHEEIKKVAQHIAKAIESIETRPEDETTPDATMPRNGVMNEIISVFSYSEDNLLERLNREIERIKESISKSSEQTEAQQVSELETRFKSLQDKYKKIQVVRNVCKKKLPSSLTNANICSQELLEVASYCNQIIAEFDRVHRNCLLVIDRAGGGKTSLLCELALSSASISPTMLVFGKENYETSNALINHVQHLIADVIGENSVNAIAILDSVLEDRGLFLNVYIDGINECRRISEFSVVVNSFIEWSSHHRIRILMTCRDIYWDFFESDAWFPFVNQTFKGQLYDFSRQEYEQALPLYFNHFKIQCELKEDAFDACKHPLLLRFFCEAYGNPNGDRVNLGPVRDIRLKELFDVYLEKKTENIGHTLGYRNGDEPTKFVLRLAKYMYTIRASSVFTDDMQAATGNANISDPNSSIYLRLLDEDIIIEEDPTAHIDQRQIHFVYEAFMEYVLARAFLGEIHRSTRKSQTATRLLDNLFDIITEWQNVRGVVEYMSLMLISDRSNTNKKLGLDLLEKMVSQGGLWVNAFWSVAGKLPTIALVPRLYDLFYPAFEVEKIDVLPLVLSSTSKYSKYDAEKLASALLWSALLPNVIRWVDIEQFDSMTDVDREAYGTKLAELYSNPIVRPKASKIDSLYIFKTVLPYLDQEVIYKIEDTINLKGKPKKGQLTYLMNLFKSFFPEHYTYLLNGLFHADEEFVRYSADNIRFVKQHHGAVAFLCKRIAAVEKSKEIRELLINSARWIEQYSQAQIREKMTHKKT